MSASASRKLSLRRLAGVCAVEMYVLRMSVRTEDTRLMSRAFTLASSRWPPKPGSAAEAVQPTVSTCQ